MNQNYWLLQMSNYQRWEINVLNIDIVTIDSDSRSLLICHSSFACISFIFEYFTKKRATRISVNIFLILVRYYQILYAFINWWIHHKPFSDTVTHNAKGIQSLSIKSVIDERLSWCTISERLIMSQFIINRTGFI